MGLDEKRAAKAFEEQRLPELKRRVDEAAGFETTFEIDWEQLSENDYSQLYDKAWARVYFEPLVAAFEIIGKDDLGKEALKGIEKIVLKNESGSASGNAFAFADGVLTLDHRSVANLDEVEQRTRKIVFLLEEGL